MNDVVGDHSKSYPAPDASRSFIERSPQAMSPFEYTDTAFAAGAPFLELFKPAPLLALLAGRTLGAVVRNRHPPHLSVDRTPAAIEINNFAAGLNDIGPTLIARVDHARPVALTARLTSDRFKTKLLI
jgi:hypothetical protein